MRPKLGILLRLAASISFMVMASLIKLVDELSAGMTLFARSLVPAVAILLWFALRGQTRALHTPQPVQHAIRALYGGVALFAWFAALRLLSLPDVQALLYLTPMTSVIMAWLILGEKADIWRIGALMTGLVGMAIIMAPRVSTGILDTGAMIGALLCLLNALAFSMSVITIRQLSRTENAVVIVFYYSLFITLFSLLTLPFGWQMPTPWHLLILLGIGVLGGLGQYLMTLSYGYAPVALLAPFEYLSLIWAIIIGAVFFSEYASTSTLVGAALIISGGLVVLYREHLVRRRTAAAAMNASEP